MAFNTFSIERLGIKTLNKIQEDTITAIEENDAVILLSATGSGKTLAYLLPILSSLRPADKKVQAMIIVPSRELALQVDDVLRKMQPGVKVTCCYGGHKREIEEQNLVETPTILIATPGRMADHIRRNNVDVSTTNFLVIDEFDKCLELGFQEEMEFILGSLPNINKRLLTSATRLTQLPPFAKADDALTLDYLAEAGETNESLRVHTVESDDKDKLETLFKLICAVKNTTSIIFCNHREAVERTSEFLADKGIVNVFYHGGMEQRDREVALCKFRNGTSDILVTTDLASRGLDIAHIRNIIHYHLPLDEGSFTHRNGRTARMNATGNVYVIYHAEEKMPAYISDNSDPYPLPEQLELPEKPKWSTLFIGAGKKDKINKVDIVGFLSNKANLKRDDLGLIEVKDFFSFAAVRKSKAGVIVEAIKDEKMKGRKIKIHVAKN